MPVTSFISVGGRIISEVTDGVILDYVPDALGSIHSVIDQDANVVKTMRYKPYGEVLSRSGTVADRHYQWVGTYGYRATFAPSSSHYVRARHYSATAGSWTTVDPLWPDESAYGYVGGKPVAFSDYSGKQATATGGGTLMFPWPWNYERPLPSRGGGGSSYCYPNNPLGFWNPYPGQPGSMWGAPVTPPTTIIPYFPGGCLCSSGQRVKTADIFDTLECQELNDSYHKACDKPKPGFKNCGKDKNGKVDCKGLAGAMDDFLVACVTDRMRILECDRLHPPGWMPNPDGHRQELCNQSRRLSKCLKVYRDNCGGSGGIGVPPHVDKLMELIANMCKGWGK